MSLPSVKLTQGIHVMHLLYRIDRVRWAQLPEGESDKTRSRLESFCSANSAASRAMPWSNHKQVVIFAMIFSLLTAD